MSGPDKAIKNVWPKDEKNAAKKPKIRNRGLIEKKVGMLIYG